MSKHLVLDVIQLANEGKTREQIADVLGVSVESVSKRLRYAKRTGRLTVEVPRKKRVTKADVLIIVTDSTPEPQT